MWNRTKIICTIGPSVNTEEKIKQLLDNGMNVARINCSHGSKEDRNKLIQLLKKVRDEQKNSLAIMLDTKGPEIRLGKIPGEGFQVNTGDKIFLVKEPIEGDRNKVSLHPDFIIDSLKKDTTLLIDDGYLSAYVSNVSSDKTEITFCNEGILKSRKSVSIRNIDVILPFLTEDDTDDIKLGCEAKVDFIAASFVRCEEDIVLLKKFLAEQKSEHIRIIAKIENSLGVQNFEKIADIADGIMIARGDLGTELSVVEVPSLQKKMLSLSRKKGRFCVTATQMLESMINNPLPTRAEVSDVANAIYDGSSAVMLSAETAAGKYPIEAVKMMSGIIKETRKHISYGYFSPPKPEECSLNISFSLRALGESSMTVAEKAKVKAILVFTVSGGTAIFLSCFRSSIPIIAITPKESTYRTLSIESGVLAFFSEHTDRAIWRKEVCQFAMDKGIVGRYDKVLVLSRTATSEETNALMLNTVSDIIS